METLVLVGAGVGVFVCLVVVAGLRWIGNDRVGIIERRWSARGSVNDGLVARSGEAGYLPAVLRGGVHWRMPLQYAVHRMSLVTVPQGRIAYVFARDGVPLAAGQALACTPEGVDFQDAEAFLASGGQRGPQRKILREGTYAINLALFVVLLEERIFHLPLHGDDPETFRRMGRAIAERDGFEAVVIGGEEDGVGIVVVHDGPALAEGEIIAPSVGTDPAVAATFHNNFQDPEAFLRAGGRRGRQLQVLVEGTYYVNRLFATVEVVAKSVVEVGHVGVVVSYTGHAGADVSGRDYKHGELVRTGQRGVWAEPLLPGKYAFNVYAGRVVTVPTTNFILKWTSGDAGAHRFDENLAEVSLITKDAFAPKLPLSVVVHIDYRNAPLVVQRFGDIKRLVEQTLDPMVAAYFKNIAQTRTLIQLLQDRADIQRQASTEMREKFAHYNLELEEVLIGTPSGANGDHHIDTILDQLRVRQIAEEQVATYGLKQRAAHKERELREAEAIAQQQKALTESELGILVIENQARAKTAQASQEAAQIRTLAEARADEVRRMADAEAERAAKVGVAEAMAIEEKVRAYGGPRYQVAERVVDRFARAIEIAKVDVVPRVVIGGQGSGNGQGANAGAGHSILETLMSLALAERLEDPTSMVMGPRKPGAEAIRKALGSGAPPPRPAHGST